MALHKRSPQPDNKKFSLPRTADRTTALDAQGGAAELL